MNKVILIGFAGQDPQVQEYGKGEKLAKFSLATNENRTNSQGEKVTETEWHNLTIFGKPAEIAEKWVKKGTKLAIEGKIKSNRYTDKEGVERVSYGIVVSSFEMLGDSNGNKKDEPSHQTPKKQPEKQPEAKLVPEIEGDLPF